MHRQDQPPTHRRARPVLIIAVLLSTLAAFSIWLKSSMVEQPLTEVDFPDVHRASQDHAF